MCAIRIGQQEVKQQDYQNGGSSNVSGSGSTTSSSSTSSSSGSSYNSNTTTSPINDNPILQFSEVAFGTKEEQAEKKAEEKRIQEEQAIEAEKQAQKKEEKKAEQEKDESIFLTNVDYNERNTNFATSTEVTNYLMQSELFKEDRLYGFNFDKEVAALMNNDQWLVDLDTNGDGKIEKGVKLVDAVAASFDSELDLYVQDKVNEVMQKLNCYDTTALFGSPNSPALQELAKLGIKVEAVGNAEKWQNRTYSFSLLDVPADLKNGDINELMKAMYGDGDTPPVDFKVIEDGNNKKASFLFSDCLIPDGVCQGAEMNFSSILDQLGKECISKADFIGHEDEYFDMLDKIQENINNGVYTGDEGIKDIYGTTMNICDSIYSLHHINSSAYGYWEGGFTSYEDGMAKLAGRTPGMGMGAFKGYSGGSAAVAGSNVPLDPNDPQAVLNEAYKEQQQKHDYNKILNEKIEAYIKENGEKPVGAAYQKIENEAKFEAQI